MTRLETFTVVEAIDLDTKYRNFIWILALHTNNDDYMEQYMKSMSLVQALIRLQDVTLILSTCNLVFVATKKMPIVITKETF